MTLAARLPKAFTTLPDLAALRQGVQKRRWPLALLWVAFLGGVTSAEIWLSHGAPPEPQQAIMALDPTPLPLVAGEDPLDHALVAAPLPGLEETTAEGKLPIISPQGLSPLRAYAAPFNRNDPRPRLAVVLTGVGLQSAPLNEAIRRLPGAVALAFSAHTPGLGKALSEARAAGHETMVAVPSDRLDADIGSDPGPGALRRALSVNENLQRLRLMFGRGSGYVGFVISPESWINSDPAVAGALASETMYRGLVMLAANDDLAYSAQAQGSPVLSTTVRLDRDLTPAGVEAALAELEQRTREMGQAVAVTGPYPLVLEMLNNWLPELTHRGLALAPVSALVADPAPSAAAPARAAGEVSGEHSESAPPENTSHDAHTGTAEHAAPAQAPAHASH